MELPDTYSLPDGTKTDDVDLLYKLWQPVGDGLAQVLGTSTSYLYPTKRQLYFCHHKPGCDDDFCFDLPLATAQRLWEKSAKITSATKMLENWSPESKVRLMDIIKVLKEAQ